MLDQFKALFEGASTNKSATTPGLDDTPKGPASQPAEIRTPPIKRIAAIRRGENCVVFPVDDVVPATDALWLGTLRESVEIRADASILVMPDQDAPALAPEGYSSKAVGEPRKPNRFTAPALSGPNSTTLQLAKSRKFLHPLMQAVHMAFSDHRPLILTPDCIWLTIVQGFSQHVQQNAEALRDRIVRHEGKLQLSLVTDSVKPESWPLFVTEFSKLIRENSDPVLHEALLCEFSTTTPTIKTACEIALMDTYQRYFDYGMICVCGIPEITLEGSVEDWRRMRDRIEVLATYDLEWWTSRLAPILDQFVATAGGQPDREFWQAIYKPQKAYALDLASGWIGDLFPYLFTQPFRGPRSSSTSRRGLCDSPSCYRNSVLSEERTDWIIPPRSSHPMDGRGVNLEQFPSGISRAPVKIQVLDGPKLEVEVMGGFLGVSQRAEDNALSPIIHWAIVQKNA